MQALVKLIVFLILQRYFPTQPPILKHQFLPAFQEMYLRIKDILKLAEVHLLYHKNTTLWLTFPVQGEDTHYKYTLKYHYIKNYLMMFKIILSYSFINFFPVEKGWFEVQEGHGALLYGKIFSKLEKLETNPLKITQPINFQYHQSLKTLWKPKRYGWYR